MITIKVDQASVRRVDRKLGKMRDQAPKVIARAINKTATTARQKLATMTKAAYTYKKSVRGDMNIKKASAGNLEAVIISAGRPHNLTSFQTSASKKSGVSAAVLRGGKKPLIGSLGIKAWRGGSGILQRRTASRYPVKFHHGPSSPKMIEGDKVYKPAEPDIKAKLKQNIDAQIRFIVG